MKKQTVWKDPIVEEVRRIREKQAAEQNYDIERISAADNVFTYACGLKVVSLDWRNPHGPRDPELPADLTGLIPDRKRFIEKVRLTREVFAARLESDLDRYNADARQRACALGLPVDSFIRHDPRVASDEGAAVQTVRTT